jgi:peroxiredoxin
MGQSPHLKYNDPAPDADLYTTAGEPIRLSSLWATQPLLLAFTRHFGCPQCKEMLHELVAAKPELNRQGLALAAVTQGVPAETRRFCEQYAPEVLCLSDPERRAYRAYGLGTATLWQMLLSPQVLLQTRRAAKHGYTAELPPRGQDMRQMSGTFIIGTDGRIRLPYYYDTIADHPPVDLLLRGVLATSWDRPFNAPLA